MVVLLVAMTLGFSSCKDEPSGGSLKDKWYVTETGRYNYVTYYEGYHFINNNTVEYTQLYSDQYVFGYDKPPLEKVNYNHYYDPSDVKTYTYQRSDNKIIIPMKGVILTLDGDRLIEDGGKTYTKI